MDAVEPAQHLLNQQLGLAIGIGRKQARIFFDWNHFRLAVDGGGGGEDQPAGAVGEHGFEQGERGGGVVAEELLGMEHGLAGLDERGKVKDAVEGSSLRFGGEENLLKSGPVCQFSLDEFHAGGQKIAPSMAQIVEDDGLMSIFGQQSGDCTTNIPRTAGHQYLHKKAVLSQTLWYKPKVYYRGHGGAD